MISRNYHHIANHPVLSNLFHGKTLYVELEESQIYLKYSVQQTSPGVDGGNDPGNGCRDDGDCSAVISINIYKWSKYP